MTRLKKIKEALEEMSTCDLVAVHNEYCYSCNYLDDHIYNMEEFDEIMDGQTPWEIARCAFYGDFCPANDYFWFNGYANLESDDFPARQIDIDAIAQYVNENNDSLYNSTLEEILEEGEEDE